MAYAIKQNRLAINLLTYYSKNGVCSNWNSVRLVLRRKWDKDEDENEDEADGDENENENENRVTHAEKKFNRSKM